MLQDNIDLNALGQAMDTTLTRSSASSGPTVTVRSVKAAFAPGDAVRVRLTYSCVVNMTRDRELAASKDGYEREGDAYIDAAAKRISKDYKEATGSTLKLKRIDVRTTVEIVDLNAFNNTRTALLRRVAVFEAS